MASRNKKKKLGKFVNIGAKGKNDFYIFGRKPIWEQLENDPKQIKLIYIISGNQESFEIKKIIQKAKENKIPLEHISGRTAAAKVGKVNDQGVIASLERFKYADQMDWEIAIRKEEKPQLVLVLDHVEDVGNFGAIIRTAAAFGVSAIFVPSDRQAPVNGTVFKTSAGNISKVKIIKISNVNQMISKLKDLKFWTYAVDMPENSREGVIWDQKFDSHTALILGAEGRGVSEKVRENCDFVVSIPMENDVESLNVSVSGAIAMYEWKRQNNK